MRITAIILARDEEIIMPFTLRHYAEFCDEIVVMDNGSRDRTAAHVGACPRARLVPYSTGGVLRDDIHAMMKSEIYRNVGQYRVTPPVSGDWFIMADADEFVHAAGGMRKALEQYEREGVTLPDMDGYEMCGDAVPDGNDERQLRAIIRTGTRHVIYDKAICVHRTLAIGYGLGAHTIRRLTGVEVRGGAHLMLLHYSFLSREYHDRKLDRIARTMPPGKDHIMLNRTWVHQWREAFYAARREVV